MMCYSLEFLKIHHHPPITIKTNNFTSVFFNEQDSNSLINAINTLSTLVINTNFIREHAKIFDDTFFIKELIEYVNREYNSFKNSI